ncbi:MAG TPA: DUF1570 domain-containing protein [Verrucomicrobiae bacterium]|nr:DUF1570 domain-containing protein [Verrucomicrobiae bacterium]
MHPKNEPSGFALPTGGALARRIMPVAIAVLNGCGLSVVSTDNSASLPTASESAPQVAVVPAETDASRPLSAEEMGRKRQLQAELAAQRPTHRIKFRDGRTLDGWLVSESPSTIRFREGFGYSGYVVESYQWPDVATVEMLPPSAPEVSPRDVRFSAEFPRFHFVKTPPYTLVTDESYGDVEKTLGVLSDLRGQFLRHFGTLIRREEDLSDVDVVLFGSEDAFRAYAQRVAPSFVDSAGFFSSGENRLVLLNQLSTTRYAQAQGRLDERGRKYQDSPETAPRLAALRSGVTSEAKSMNERLVRHEGAHQLFHAYHIHSRYGLEPTWLTEGLAEYCETTEIGHYHSVLAERVIRARRGGQLLSLTTLLNHRNPSGFFVLEKGRIELAYAESWALVYMLMQDNLRPQFFNYIKSYRDVSTYRQITALERAEPETLLEAQLNINRNTLEQQWDSFITHL